MDRKDLHGVGEEGLLSHSSNDDQDACHVHCPLSDFFLRDDHMNQMIGYVTLDGLLLEGVRIVEVQDGRDVEDV